MKATGRAARAAKRRGQVTAPVAAASTGGGCGFRPHHPRDICSARVLPGARAEHRPPPAVIPSQPAPPRPSCSPASNRRGASVRISSRHSAGERLLRTRESAVRRSGLACASRSPSARAPPPRPRPSAARPTAAPRAPRRALCSHRPRQRLVHAARARASQRRAPRAAARRTAALAVGPRVCRWGVRMRACVRASGCACYGLCPH